MLQKLKALASLANLVPAVAVATAATIGFQLSEPVLETVVFPQKPEIAVVEPATPIITTGDTESAEATPLAQEALATGNFTDGTYYGSGQGFSGVTKAEVIVQNRQISAVNIVNTKDDASFFNRAKEGVISAILSRQTWEVDSVSGATYSSRGIKEAVKNALTGSTELSSAPTASTSTTKKKPTSSKFTMGTLKDGTFTGSAKGFDGTIKVSVTVSGGKIASIKITSHSGETDSYFNKAKKIVNTIIKKQTPNVDTISGATYSSNGIREAVKNALKKASGQTVKETEIEKTTEDTTPAVTPAVVPEGLPANGVYSAQADCKLGKVFDYVVTVTAAYLDGKVVGVSLSTTDSGKNQSFIDKAWTALQQMLLNQPVDEIDTVSGATYTSKAVLTAYRAVYTQAIEANGGTVSEDEQPPAESNEEDENKGDSSESGENAENTETPEQKPDEEEPDSPSEEGGDTSGDSSEDAPEETPVKRVFDVSATVYCDENEDFWDYGISASVTFVGDKLTAMTIKADTDDDYNLYCVDEAKKGVIPQLLSKQSAEVDTVSGATCSSKGIIDLYRVAKKRNDAQLSAGE